MQTTTNYGLKIYEGTDLFNPLTVENVNTSDLDTIVKGVSNAAVGTATELLTGTVHALTRADTARNVFHFTATANFEAGETFEVDGVQVTAKTPDGQNLSTGAYVINSSVLCILDGTLLTVIVNPAKALDADKLDGHDSTYFATAGDLTVLDNQVGAISTKVGTGVLDVGNDCVDGINTLNTHFTDIGKRCSTPIQAPTSIGGSVNVTVTDTAHNVWVIKCGLRSGWAIWLLAIGSIRWLTTQTSDGSIEVQGTAYNTLAVRYINKAGDSGDTVEVYAIK
jgi:hypothetical protein